MYTIVRRGDFYAVPTGNNHCGLENSPHRFEYEVSLSCTDTDEQGFIYDQYKIHAHFEQLGNVELSCEQLAHKVAVHFLKQLPQCASIKVFISSTRLSDGGAFFELTSEELPTWKRNNRHHFVTDDSGLENDPVNFGFNIGHAGDLMHEEKYEHVACVEGEKLRELYT